MRKSWLMCVLLGTLAWGQAAPSTPPPAQAPTPGAPMQMTPPAAAPDTSASVPLTAAVITVIGVCPPTQTAAPAAKGTSAKPVTKAKTAAADCKTIITKKDFEELAAALIQKSSPQARKQLASVLPRYIGMSSQAQKLGLDKKEQYKETLKFARMNILTTMLQRQIQDDAAKISPAEIKKYYDDHLDTFEQFNVDRLFIPRAKQAEAEAKEDDDKDKDEKLTDDQKKAKEAADKAKTEESEQAMTKLATSLQARAAAGEDFIKLQKEAFEAAGMKMENPTVNLPSVRRTGLPPAHAAVFDLKPGEVSQVISDSGAHYVYKVNSKDHVTLEAATNEIHSKLQNDKTREMMDKVNNSFKVETNEAYFGPGGVSAAPPPRMPHPRMPPGAPNPGGQPQTPPPAQPPAAKPD